MPNKPVKKCVIFDLDDTLIPSSKIYDEALARVGVDLDKYNDAREHVKKTLGSNHPASHHRLLYFKRMLEMQNTYSVSKTLEMIRAYESALTDQLAKYWIASSRTETLKELAKHFHLAILTNETTRTQLLKLNVIDPASEFFQYVLTSEEVGSEKPDLKIFKTFFERFNKTPEQCIFIGDDIHNDIAPAIEMRMEAILLTEFLHQPKEVKLPIKVVKKFAELKNILC